MNLCQSALVAPMVPGIGSTADPTDMAQAGLARCDGQLAARVAAITLRASAQGAGDEAGFHQHGAVSDPRQE